MKDPKDYIIFPLDVATAGEAESLVAKLDGLVGVFKIGLELFIHAGPQLVRRIGKDGKNRVFLDLKLHDIPETVYRAIRQIVALGVDFATVHCGETSRMLEAAAEAAGGRINLLGVTVLTSVSDSDLAAAGYNAPTYRTLSEQVLHRAILAQKAGLAGVICAGQEVPLIKSRTAPSFMAVTPGIRFGLEKAGDDQRRITTPAAAIAAGADYLVIGRPIRDAADPRRAAAEIAAEIASAI